MSKEKATPHLDKWLRTFKTVGRGVGKVASGVLESAAPSVTSSAQSVVQATREAANFYNDSKSKVKTQLTSLNNSFTGKSAQSILNAAYNDIKNGTFSLDKSADNSYDSIDDFDSYIDNISVDSSDPNSVALGESKKNMAILGRTVAEGNVATIEGMKNMTATISNVQIKTSHATTTKMANIILTGTNQLVSQIAGVNGRLDVINQNLVSILDFQRNNASVVNQAAVEYYSQSSQMINDIGAVISEMRDFIEANKSMKRKRPDSPDYDIYDMSSGFSFDNYKELVKHNWKSSPMGTAMSMMGMVGSFGSMSSSIGMSPLDMLLTMGGNMLLPKKTRKSVERLDKVFASSIDELLYKIGDMRYDNNSLLKPIIGSLLGKERDKISSTANLGNFKKDYMGWNGVAQKTLVEVIPSYLARIEASLTKKDERYYNMDTGQFMSREDIKKKYSDNVNSSISFNMQEFTNSLNEEFEKSNVSEELANSIYSNINNVINDVLLGKTDSKDLGKNLFKILNGNISANAVRDLTMQGISNYNDFAKARKEFNSSIEEDITGSIYRTLFNEGQKSTDYYKKADINSGVKFTKGGKSYEDMTEEERLKAEADDALDKNLKKFGNKIKKFFKKTGKDKNGGFDQKISSYVDRATNFYFDKVYGYNDKSNDTTSNDSIFTDDILNESSEAPIRSKINISENPSTSSDTAAKAAYISGSSYEFDDDKQIGRKPKKVQMKSKINVHSFNDRQRKNIEKAQAKLDNENLNDVLESTDAEINADINNVNNILRNSKADDDKFSLKSLILSLYTNFLKPMASNIFGKNGIFHKVTDNKLLKKIKHSLFDEKNGIFGGLTSWVKDQFDYLKYTLTGKGYTNRSGETFKDNENSLFGNISKGYDFVLKNTMTYIFGEDYKNNENYKKYFSWLDFKGKKERKKKQEYHIDSTDEAIIGSGNYTYDIKDEKIKNNSKKKNRKAKRLKSKTKSKPSSNIETALFIAEDNLISASEDASNQIITSANILSTEVLGTEEGLNKVQEETTEDITSKFKKNLPKTITAGAAGAAIGASTAIHGAGLIGSLFLPGGPISGAILGIGLSFASRSKKFQEFLFGKEDSEGKKTGGLISNSMQNFVKKNMPLLVGGATVGIFTKMAKSAVGLGNGGFLLNTLLPGGPIGGAVMGLGIALLKNNEKFNKILFGEKADNDSSERTGGMFSKSYNTAHRIFEKSGNFIKGGTKGIGGGLLAGATISKMGVLGAALTASGPVGWGLTGLGLGIASQSKKFQELLFGTEEYDENGNFKGRTGNGLLTKVRNMLTLNVFEPLHDKLQENVEDFAYWLKRNIKYPFRLAFGPIIDSMKTIKTDIVDVVHESFNNIADTVGKALKSGIDHILKPFTSLSKLVGNAILKTVRVGAQMSLLPISVPLKLLAFTTRGARRKAKGLESRTIFEHFGDIYSGVREKWKTEDKENANEYKGFGGRINKFLTHGRDLIQGIDAAKLGYEQGLNNGGQNSANWMNVGREKAADKVDISNLKKNRNQWREIDKYRSKILKENNWADLGYNAEENAKIRKKLHKMGIDKDWIASDDDLNLFFKSKKDWRNKFDPTKNKSIEDLAKNGIKLNETGEQAQARRNTAEYQKNVINRFDTIVKEFTKLGAKVSISKKKNLDLASIKEIDKDLKDQGITWKDIGIDPSTLSDVRKLGGDEWDEFLEEKFKNGEVTNGKGTYSKFIKRKLEHKEELMSRTKQLHEALNEKNDEVVFDGSRETDVEYVKKFFSDNKLKYNFKSFDDFKKWLETDITTPLKEMSKSMKETEASMKQTEANTGASSNIDMSEASMNGASNADLKKATGFRLIGKNASIFKAMQRFIKRGNAAEEEKEKDAYLKRAKSLQDEEDLSLNKAVIDGMEEDEKAKKKGTVFGVIKSGIKGLLGSIFGWIFSPKTWKIAGLGLGIMGIYGGKIKEFFDPLIGKFTTFMKEKGLPFLGNVFNTAMDFISEKAPAIIETITNNIVNNMGALIQSTAKILWSAITTTGKVLVNKLATELGQDAPFEINGSRDKGGKTYETYDEAIEANNGITSNVYQNADGSATIMNKKTDIDENGNTYQIGNSGLKSSLAREGIQFIRSPLNRKMARATTKGIVKAVGWATGITPIGKLAKGVVRGTVSAGKGAYNTGKAIVNIAKVSRNKVGKEIAEEAVESAVIRKGAWALKKSGENYVTRNGKIITADAAKKRLKNGTGYIVEDFAKKTSKKSTEAIIETNLENGAKKIAKEGAEAATEQVIAKKGIKKFLEKAKKMISKAASWVADKIPMKNFKKFVNELIENLAKKLSSSSNKMLQKVGEHITEKTAKATGRSVASASVLIGAGFAVWDGINGALNASYLFGINDDKVTASMRLVSSIMEILLGTGPGAWIDIVLEVYAMITGKNAKQWFAHKLWKFLPGTDDSYLDDALTEMELETEKYNRANGTNLSVKEYSEKKNSSNSITGRISKGWTKIWNKDKYKKKYDYSAYEVTDAELEEYKKQKQGETISSNVNKTSQQSINNYNGEDLIYNGPGKGRRFGSRTIGYGSLQSDKRWADYDLGKFPDGSDSTMATGGCGPTALSMVANSYGNTSSPLAFAEYAKENGYIKDGGATADLFTDGASKLGLKPSVINKTNLKSALVDGEPVVLAGKSHSSDSVYTQAGHVVMAQGIDGNYVHVNDPMRGSKIIKMSDITKGMTHGWAYSKAVGYGDPKIVDGKYLLTDEGLYKSPFPYLSDAEYTAQVIGTSMYDKDKLTAKTNKKIKSERSVKKLKKFKYTNPTETIRWRSNSEIDTFIKEGYKKSKSKGYKWNTPSYYNGLSVAELKALASHDSNLLYDKEIPLFGLVYTQYVSSGKYKSTDKLSTLQVEHILSDNEEIKNQIENPDSENGEASDNSLGGIFSGILSGLLNIGENLLTALVTGNSYKSIYDTENTEENSTEETNTESSDSAEINDLNTNDSTTHTSSNGSTHGGSGGSWDTSGSDWGPNGKYAKAQRKNNVKSDPNKVGSPAWLERAQTRSLPPGASSSPLKEKGDVARQTNGLINMSFKSALGTTINGLTGKGGGSKDFAIWYGPKNKLDDKDKTENTTTTDSSSNSETGQTQSNGGIASTIAQFGRDIKAIGYARQAQMLGQDYETAKQEYYSLTSNTGSQSGENGNSANTGNLTFASTENETGTMKTVPEGYGKIHTYMGWQCITSPTSDQMKLRNAVENYDSEGFGRVGDRYAVAMKSYYGSVGDYLNITQEDGYQYKVALADIKGTENGSTGVAKYVHGDGSMVEFVVDKASWYSKEKGGHADKMHANPGSANFHPELHDNIKKIEYVGNYWKNDADKSGDTYKGFGPIKKYVSKKSRALGYGGNWLQIIQAVKEALAAKKLGYSQSKFITLNVLGQTLQSVRTDCSGYVSACLRLYGALSSNTTSSGLCNASSIKGFTKGSWQGWDSLSPGDIISKHGHTEIFVKNEGGKHYVYTCGSTSSINNPGTNTDSGSYTVVWRPNEMGSFVDSGTQAASVGQTGTSSILSPLDGLFSSIGNTVKNVLGFGYGSSRTPAGWFSQTLNGEITSDYGKRNDVFGNEFHRGIDIASAKGTSVRSPIDGIVVSSGSDVAGYGNYAVVQSRDGNNHVFAHLNKPVGYGNGTIINKNDVIGEVGSTGKSTGDHLHYEIRRDGNKYSTINPMNYKYDRDVSKHLNISNQNHTSNEGIGGGTKDINSKDLTNKLNVALNTSNVETKLDSLIEVMKSWAERDAEASKTTQNNTNITTNNVVYGSGKGKKKSSTTKRSSTKDITSKNLTAIHDAIAAKA